jgi:hypothetical protein
MAKSAVRLEEDFTARAWISASCSSSRNHIGDFDVLQQAFSLARQSVRPE